MRWGSVRQCRGPSRVPVLPFRSFGQFAISFLRSASRSFPWMRPYCVQDRGRLWGRYPTISPSPDYRAERTGMTVALPTVDELQSLSIPTPCNVPWGEMRGNDRSRFCGLCKKRVFDLSAMTTAEAAALLADAAEQPCVRLYRQSDGRVLTTDCSGGLRVRIWRRVRRRAEWLASLFAMLILPACRTATQGLPGHLYTETTSSLPARSDALAAPQSEPANP
jgi:hypothetical protein